ncbi:upstream activation factor subunit spp27-like [Cornus florida]|uniref:upstream activation factor subunit spp27-like n=1 Tax=Cornus florida TaxID=4283 RepID=UPI0028A0A58F|nr:upstream activation factor subunit spp27-like [Cornus florida]
MSSRVFKGCRALLAAAKAETAKSTAAKKGTATKKGTAAAKATKPLSSSPRPPKQPSTVARSSGILKVSPISPALSEFLGVPESSRTDAVKKIWAYIKLQDLQDPVDRKVICCDTKLKTVFDGKDRVGFLEIGKLLTQHFVKTG